MTVRPIEVRDIPPVVTMARELASVGSFAGLPFDEVKVARIVLMTLDRLTHAGWIAEAGGQPVGFMLARTVDYLICDQVFAMDMGLYVRPEARGGRHAVRLVRAFEAWAAGVKATEAKIMVNTGVGIERTDRFLRRLGYTCVGGAYAKGESDVWSC